MTDERAAEDPIIAEVRAARAALLAAAGGDLEEYARRLRAEQARSGHPVVSLPAKPAAAADSAA
jgi:hypothetical protein